MTYEEHLLSKGPIEHLIAQVEEFHTHMNIEPRSELFTEPRVSLDHASNVITAHAHKLLDRFKDSGDVRHLRAHLLCEELGEFLHAMNHGDKTNMLDGLCDLLYVLIGTAAVFGMPLQEGFDEVHRSNMTKKPSDQRCSDKTGYEPAQLGDIPWKP